MSSRVAAPAGWQARWRQLVKELVRVHSPAGEQQLLDWLAQPRAPAILGFVNAHAMNTIVGSPPFFDALHSADILLRDGSGMAILLRLLKQSPGLNLNGTDLIPKILGRFTGATIALFGTRDPFLSRAREVVESSMAPGSRCVAAHGFHETSRYIQLAQEHRPALIVLAMGMPRQEQVAVALRGALGHACLIVCGGAILDFVGNKHGRAPRWMRATGLEWLFRLAREPRRLFSRYVVGNPVFLARALLLASGNLRSHPAPPGRTLP